MNHIVEGFEYALGRAAFWLAAIAASVGAAVVGFVWLCVWYFVPTSEPPKPVEKVVYATFCQGCGTEWNSAGPPKKPIRSCPNCPLNVCDKGVGYLLTFGTIQGIANAQPENAEVQEKWANLQAEMAAHFEECEQCRKAFAKEVRK